MEELFAGIDLGSGDHLDDGQLGGHDPHGHVREVAEGNGAARRALGGTVQNDILKEYQAQKEYIFPPRPQHAAGRRPDPVLRRRDAPTASGIGVGYHIREAGSTAAQELAFTLANGFAYVEAALASGLAIDDWRPGCRSSSTRTSISSRRSASSGRHAVSGPAGWPTRYGAQSERSMQLRFHAQTAGVSLTAEQPEVNIARVARRGAGCRLRRYPESPHRRL